MSMEMKWWGDKAKGKASKGAARGLMFGSEHVLDQANRVVPVAQDGGTLLRSGVADIDESELTAAVSYDTVYAARQHEELTWQHAPGKQAKYLEMPLNEAQQSGVVARLIAREIAKEFR